MDAFIRLIKDKCSSEGPIAVSKCKPPGFCAVFLRGRDLGDIILVSKQDSTDVSFALDNSDSDIEQADLTGNPLEAPFSDVSLVNDLTINLIGDAEVSVMPPGVSIIVARTIISLYNLKGPDNSLPIWVVVDGKTSHGENGFIRLMYAEKRNGLITVGVGVDTGISDSEPNPSELIAKMDPSTDSIRGARNWNIACAYNFRPDGDSSNRCRLSMSWRQPEFRPPLSSQSLDVIVEVEYQPRGGGSPTQFLWDQYLLITNYLKLLDTGAEGSAIKLPSSEPVVLQLPKCSLSPIEKLKAALTETNVQVETPVENEKFLANLIATLSSPTNLELDLLGKLWFIFIECTTVKELKDCFMKLNLELKEGRLESHVDQIVTSLTVHRGVFNNPLNQLIEFGIEKLKKDLLAIFAEAEIFPCLPSLSRFSHLMADEWRPTVDKSLVWLRDSLCLFEVLVSIEKLLNVPIRSMQSLSADFRAQIAQNSVDDINAVRHLRSTVAPNSVANLLNERYPDEWLMTIVEKKSESYEVKSDFFYGTVRPMVPHYDHAATEAFDQTDCGLDNDEKLDSGLWSAALHVSTIKKPIL